MIQKLIEAAHFHNVRNVDERWAGGHAQDTRAGNHISCSISSEENGSWTFQSSFCLLGATHKSLFLLPKPKHVAGFVSKQSRTADSFWLVRPAQTWDGRDIPCIYNLFFLTVNCFVRPESILVLCVYIRSVFSIPISAQTLNMALLWDTFPHHIKNRFSNPNPTSFLLQPYLNPTLTLLQPYPNPTSTLP